MPAHSDAFPWPPHYGHFNFFESRMLEHDGVANFRSIEDGLYELTLRSGKTLKVFVCECYSYGEAEYTETIEKLGRLDAIIINSVWCGYTIELKMRCRVERVGLFSVGDFMGALRSSKFWLYLNKHDKKRYREKGWL